MKKTYEPVKKPEESLIIGAHPSVTQMRNELFPWRKAFSLKLNSFHLQRGQVTKIKVSLYSRTLDKWRVNKLGARLSSILFDSSSKSLYMFDSRNKRFRNLKKMTNAWYFKRWFFVSAV